MKKQFFAAIYHFKGPTFIGPTDEWILGKNKVQHVIAFEPPKQVDPLRLYIYVTDGENTYSVSKKTLEWIEITSIDWIENKRMTPNQAITARLKAMNDYFNIYKKSIHHFPSDTFKTIM